MPEKFTVTFETTNASFEDDLVDEIRQILRRVTRQVELGHTSRAVLDSNGNFVGKWSLS